VLHRDPSISGKVLYFLAEGETSFGIQLPPPLDAEEPIRGSGLSLGRSSGMSTSGSTGSSADKSEEMPTEQQADVVGKNKTPFFLQGCFSLLLVCRCLAGLRYW
jgi:hypothetical protein